MIADDEIERDLAWLDQHSGEIAQRRAERVYAEEFRKSLKAILMNESNEATAAAKEAWAYSHPKYIEHLATLKAAVFRDEEARAKREARLTRVEAFRTLSANRRGI